MAQAEVHGLYCFRKDHIHKKTCLLYCRQDHHYPKPVCTAAGKTTFIKNLFASYTQDPNLQVNDVPGSTSKDTFVQHPDKLLTEIVVRDERNMLAYHYRVQDTPGQSCHSHACISLWHDKTHAVGPSLILDRTLVQSPCWVNNLDAFYASSVQGNTQLLTSSGLA